VACVRLGRNFVGFDLDENYLTIASKRIEDEILAKKGAGNVS